MRILYTEGKRFDDFVFDIFHLRGLCDTIAFPGTLRVIEAAPGLHAAAGLHHEAETQDDLRGCGGAHTQNTYHKRVENLLNYSCNVFVTECT